jgi:hypothetical protein
MQAPRPGIKCHPEELNLASLPRPGALGYEAMRDLKWSPAEKAVARKAFDLALKRELEAVIIEAKKQAGNVRQPSDLWELERFLSKRHPTTVWTKCG